MEIGDIKKVIDAQGEAFEEFKRANDELIKAKADGKAVGDLETKVARLNDALSDMTGLREQFTALQTKMQRPNFGGGNGDDE